MQLFPLALSHGAFRSFGSSIGSNLPYDACTHKESRRYMVTLFGAVPRYPLQKPPSRGLEGSGGEGGGWDEGLKVEGGFTFGRLQGGLQRGLKGA